MSEIRASVFIGRDNSIRLLLSSGTSLLMESYPDLAPTRWLLILHQATVVTLDSDELVDAFHWDAASSTLQINPGPYLTETSSYVSTTLVMYAAEFPNGIILLHPTDTTDKLRVRVNDED